MGRGLAASPPPRRGRGGLRAHEGVPGPPQEGAAGASALFQAHFLPRQSTVARAAPSWADHPSGPGAHALAHLKTGIMTERALFLQERGRRGHRVPRVAALRATDAERRRGA